MAASGVKADAQQAQPSLFRLFAFQQPIAQRGALDALALPLHDIAFVFRRIVIQQIAEFSAFRLRFSFDDGEVFLLHALGGDQRREGGRRLAAAGIDHHAADVPVEAMHGIDPAAALLLQQLRQAAALGEQAGRFDTDEQPFILI